MRYTPDDIWSEILSELGDVAREDPYLRQAKPTKITEDELTISVSTPITRDEIEKRFLPDINRLLTQRLGQDKTLNIIVKPNTPKRSTAPTTDPMTDSTPSLPASDTPSDEEATQTETGLNPQYTFDRFIVGSSNRLSHAAAVAVSENPGKIYNPLFFYGGVGLGKTHLLHAIGNHIQENQTDLKVVYVSSETFMNEYIDSIIRSRTTSQDFRDKYRTADVLLIDDIQFLQRKEGTQEEFFNTFNELHLNSNHIVMTSDRPPKNLENVEERLRSRFEWGMLADISAPLFETRVAILHQKCRDHKIDFVSDSVLNYIAEVVEGNIRKLEGALTHLVANASIFGEELTVDFARRTISHIQPASVTYQHKAITADDIQKTVARYYGIRVSELKSSKRTKLLVFPRQVAMYLCRELTNLSLTEVASAFGRRDHTTVMHACDRVEQAIEQDPELNQIISSLTESIS
jgi:chromosomal replication initiator protein